MSVDPAEIPTKSDNGGCPTVSIGLVGDLLLVGNSFERTYCWEDHDFDPDVVDSSCDFEPIDFTNYNVAAQIFDANGIVVETFAVTPNPGDATGCFTVSLTPAQTTTTLRDTAVE